MTVAELIAHLQQTCGPDDLVFVDRDGLVGELVLYRSKGEPGKLEVGQWFYEGKWPEFIPEGCPPFRPVKIEGKAVVL